MTHLPNAYLGPRRLLVAGGEAEVKFPGRGYRTRARFRYADEDGNLTFTDPRTGHARTVRPDAVGTIHHQPRLRPS